MLKSQYYFTGAENRRYFCQLIIFHSGNEKIYSFCADFDNQNLNIVKKGYKWTYHSGRDLYLDKWVTELGEQVDSGNFGKQVNVESQP